MKTKSDKALDQILAEFSDHATLTPEEASRLGYFDLGEIAKGLGCTRETVRNIARKKGMEVVRVRTGQCGTRQMWVRVSKQAKLPRSKGGR